MKHTIKKWALFLRLMDPDNKLSLTNIAVMVVLFKLATAKEAITPVDVGALISTMLGYQAKKVIGKMKDKSGSAGENV